MYVIPPYFQPLRSSEITVLMLLIRIHLWVSGFVPGITCNNADLMMRKREKKGRRNHENAVFVAECYCSLRVIHGTCHVIDATAGTGISVVPISLTRYLVRTHDIR